MTNRKIPLKQLCFEDACGVYGIPASAEDYDKHKIRYLRITDISDDGDLLNNDKKSVSATNIEKYILNENDIVFARTGNSTGRTYFHENKNGKLAYAGFLIKYSLDNNKVNPKYLKYYTLSNEYKNWVKNLSVGSTRGNINAQTFANCLISLPERNQQDLLVSTLNLLTDKIDLNNKINCEIEQFSKMIFDYWFAQFDFPDSKGNSYRSTGGKMVWNNEIKREIPVDWQIKELNQVVEIGKEQINPSNNPNKLFKHYSIPSFDDIGMYSLEEGSTIKSNKFIINKLDVLVSKLNPWFNRVVYSLNEEDQISSTEFVVWKPKNIELKNFLFMLARDKSFISYCVKSSSGTSHSHRRVNPNVMMSYKIPFNEKAIFDFGAMIDPFLKQYFNNKQENILLKSFRNWILPKLMNGQVKVKDN